MSTGTCQYCGEAAYRSKVTCRACSRRLSRRRLRRWGQESKLKVMEAYGGARCALCGYEGQALTLDHVQGGGREHRKALTGYPAPGIYFYRTLLKLGCPQDPPLQVLCMNCNWEKHNHEIEEGLE